MSQEINIRVLQKLKLFKEADTSSEMIGQIEVGEYQAHELRKNYPDSTTDYISVHLPNGTGWICSRYQHTIYAEVIDEQLDDLSDISLDDDAMAIDEIRLIELLPQFEGFTYNNQRARYPFVLRGCNIPLAPPFANDCCTFIEALLVKAWENAHPDFTWNAANHNQMMIISTQDRFSPITCLVSRQMALKINNPDQKPKPWTALQVWRKQWTGGHTFIILDYHAETDRILTLESNQAYKLNGVGFREIGNLRDVPKPSSDWWKDDSLWTWERVKTSYPFRQQCLLKVVNRSWV